MWYRTGTINLTINSPAVTGSGTAWADARFGVMPGMALLAPDNKLYEILRVNSNTSLTLNTNYAGPTATGQAYAIITTYEGDISQFSARFAAMLTFFQGSRNDTVTWFTGTGDMTFTKDDGTKLTIPTLAKIQADYLSRTVTTEQKVASTVSFAGLKIGDIPVLKAGDYGVGGAAISFSGSIDDVTIASGTYLALAASSGTKPGSSPTGHLSVSREGVAGVTVSQKWTPNNDDTLYVRRYYPSGWSIWKKTWHDGNTTVDANGFIKKASPIVKLFGSGESELNEESRGVTTERVEEGVYRVSGVFGFNGDGAWGGAGNGIEIPVDDNKRPLVWVESKVLQDGDIEIRTYHRTYDTGPYSARNIEIMDSGEVYKQNPIYIPMPDGTPIDIPAGRWIDLRVEMPGGDEPEYETVPEGGE